jgi:deazaflavin-dependent oxidoreductase (nitroreductase family)
VPSDHFYARLSGLGGATGLRLTGKMHVPLYRATGGRIGGKVGRAPVLLLTTTGRKSGEPRTTPVLYLEIDKKLILIDTNAGNAKIPAWSWNLKAKPEAEVEIGRKRQAVHARSASGEERAELWRKSNEQYSGFDEYVEKLGPDREVTVFVLDPS